MTHRQTGRRTQWLVAWVLSVSMLLTAPAVARNQIDEGFNLEELIRLAGAGPDPGPADLRARLDWAVSVAIPPEWAREVSAQWMVGDAGSGQLALSYPQGRSVISPRVLNRSTEWVLSTVAHEMGHQVTFQVVEPFNGYPPQEFIDRAGDYFIDVREGWADCVARAWTGSTLHTLSESVGCSRELAHFTATLLDDPDDLRPEPVPSPVPEPSRPVTSPSPSPSPVFSPIKHPMMADYLDPAPTASPTARNQAAPESTPEPVPGGMIVLIAVVAAILLLAGRRLTKIPNDRLVEWASRAPSGDSKLARLRKKLFGDL